MVLKYKDRYIVAIRGCPGFGLVPGLWFGVQGPQRKIEKLCVEADRSCTYDPNQKVLTKPPYPSQPLNSYRTLVESPYNIAAHTRTERSPSWKNARFYIGFYKTGSKTPRPKANYSGFLKYPTVQLLAFFLVLYFLRVCAANDENSTTCFGFLRLAAAGSGTAQRCVHSLVRRRAAGTGRVRIVAQQRCLNNQNMILEYIITLKP